MYIYYIYIIIHVYHIIYIYKLINIFPKINHVIHEKVLQTFDSYPSLVMAVLA